MPYTESSFSIKACKSRSSYKILRY